MVAYYNEFDPFAAAWLRELIKAGHIAPGDVDERSIEDVPPDDLRGYVQCHFFAGIGVWSYALRRAGWPDDRPVWTGSCPCQPFSAAGKGKGFADERHLWPAFFHLINQQRPLHIFGEQVASKGGLAWLEIVQTDLEDAEYAVGAVDTCSAGFGAPHIRQRLYWVAHTASIGCQQNGRCVPPSRCNGFAGDSSIMRMADSTGQQEHQEQQRPQTNEGGRITDSFSRPGMDSRLANPMPAGRPPRRPEPGEGKITGSSIPGPTNGHWRGADWLFCRDGKWRPVESGSFPLAHGAPARVGRLRGYGNAINAIQAEEFIRAYMAIQ